MATYEWCQWTLSTRPRSKGTILGNTLYLHGGISSGRTAKQSNLNGLFCIQISPILGTWVELTDADSPYLSQHACVSFADRYLVFIGGWNGQARIPGIHTYDTVSRRWLSPAVAEPLLKGFPTGAGLSAHTVTLLEQAKSNTKLQALIIGREGSLRTQRKTGNIYLLRGDFSAASSDHPTAKFTYFEADPGLNMSSRSYHTSTPVGPTTIATIGGRKDRAVEVLSWSPSKKSSPDWPGQLSYPPSRCTLVSELIASVKSDKTPFVQLPPTHRSCWRGHSAIPGDGGVFISSGEGFNALVRDPLDDAYVYCHQESGGKSGLLSVGKLHHPRAYAVCDVHPSDGTAWLYGGLGPGGKTQNTLMKLEKLPVTE